VSATRAQKLRGVHPRISSDSGDIAFAGIGDSRWPLTSVRPCRRSHDHRERPESVRESRCPRLEVEL
jgi:hypothetical protein